MGCIISLLLFLILCVLLFGRSSVLGTIETLGSLLASSIAGVLAVVGIMLIRGIGVWIIDGLSGLMKAVGWLWGGSFLRWLFLGEEEPPFGCLIVIIWGVITIYITFAYLLTDTQPAKSHFRASLPSDALIIEAVDLPSAARLHRKMVLWMRSPHKSLRQDRHFHTCPDAIYGDRWIGATYLSLFDEQRSSLLNTIDVVGPENKPGGHFSIPFEVRDGYYKVINQNDKREGAPTILNLRDLTGDGIAAEFALFDYVACGIAETSAFGYDQRSDRVVQYTVETGGHKHLWVQQIFAHKPTRAGYWDFSWHPGHGSTRSFHERVSFDPARQLFVRTADERQDPE